MLDNLLYKTPGIHSFDSMDSSKQHNEENKISLLIINNKGNIDTNVHTHQGTLQARAYRPCSQKYKDG